MIRARVATYGGDIAAPVFSAVVGGALRLMGIEPDAVKPGADEALLDTAGTGAPMSAPTLRSLLAGIVPVANDIPLTDVTLDSRQVRTGGAFLACRGGRRHEAGFRCRCRAAPVRPPSFGKPTAHACRRRSNRRSWLTEVPQLSAEASRIADRFFAAPSQSLDVVGVTGTNGKTTCAWLLAQALTACGRPTAYLGTLGAAFGGELAAGELTTPDAVTVQRELAGFRDRGARGVAMEVSSHAMALHRVAAVRFGTAVFTNLTRDHLDFHGDMTSYGAAKAALFTQAGLRQRVINVDDAFGAGLAAQPAFRARIACSRAVGGADPVAPFVRARDVVYARRWHALPSGVGFREGADPVATAGRVQRGQPAGRAGGVAGPGASSLRRRLPSCADYRRPAVGSKRLPSQVARSWSSTMRTRPDALASALSVLRRHCTGRLVCVFGCGGDRDRGKRAEMGAIAARLADEVTLTDDNPRSEDPARIVADIRVGMQDASPSVIHDRRQAIAQAIAGSRAGDVVLIAGKGHETWQQVGDERRPFSDQRVAREQLAVGVGS